MMGQNTKIEWAHHTFNPWIGCTKVQQADGSIHPACINCYAEAESKRRGWAQWGKGKPRHRTTPGYWSKPLAWNRAAAKKGIRERVFCASLSDIFDAEVTQEWREQLFALIDKCPNLDWLILTKRPENILLMIPPSWQVFPPKNVLMGTSVSDQPTANEFIPRLLAVGHIFKLFVSIEPLISGIDLQECGVISEDWFESKISWCIVGGESGPKARPLHPYYALSLRDQCSVAGIKFLFKQWGEYLPDLYPNGQYWVPFDHYNMQTGKGFQRVGKTAAGRILEGQEYTEFPEVKI